MDGLYADVLKISSAYRGSRAYPKLGDERSDGANLFPTLKPKFHMAFESDTSVFTIGSCFARNIEIALDPLGVRLPTRLFVDEWEDGAGSKSNQLLNEYNPGTMCQRIMDALEGRHSHEATLVEFNGGVSDLLLHTGPEVPRDRALTRRAKIFDVYQMLRDSGIVILTLGLVEGWYDREAKSFLNRIPPAGSARREPERFVFRRLDVPEVTAMLEEALGSLGDLGIKVVLTVSPVPLRTTFTTDDCVIANEFSKSVLRIAADHVCKRFSHVDYFPSYEIVRSGGLTSYTDNIHVRDDLVAIITNRMVQLYSPPVVQSAAMASAIG